MLVVLFLLVTLLLAALALRTAWRAARRPLRDAAISLWAALSLGGLAYLYGTWVFASVYLRYVFAATLLLFVIRAVLISANQHADAPKPNGGKPLSRIIAGIICTALVVVYYTGTTGISGTINLSLPFRKGNYLVFQGGKGLPANLFHVQSRGAVYAMDLVKLNSFGNRAATVFSKHLADYETFGDTVLAPCTGIVLNVRDDNPDNIPPNRERGPHNLNSILIETPEAFVFLGHFKQGSVMVQEGDLVIPGEPIALAGNSGASLEPHLHLQAHAKDMPGEPWYRQKPLFMRFSGKAYLLNDIIHGQ